MNEWHRLSKQNGLVISALLTLLLVNKPAAERSNSISKITHCMPSHSYLSGCKYFAFFKKMVLFSVLVGTAEEFQTSVLAIKKILLTRWHLTSVVTMQLLWYCPNKCVMQLCQSCLHVYFQMCKNTHASSK